MDQLGEEEFDRRQKAEITRLTSRITAETDIARRMDKFKAETDAANPPPVVVRVYPGRTQADAAALYARDAVAAVKRGYEPTSQSWSEGRPGVARYLTLGLASLVFKPKGFLTVTYSLRDRQEQPAAAKVCPMCAEEVKASALICRFCRYEFREADTGDNE